MNDGFNETIAALQTAAQTSGRPEQFRSLIGAHQYLRAYRLVARCVPSGSEVLDWGAGNGHFSFHLVRAGYRTSGFGFAPVPEICSGFVPEKYCYRQGDAKEPRRLPFDDASFDAVVSIGVLEHVRETGGDELASLREINRVLRPGGVFMCFHLPNRFSWIEPLAKRADRWWHRYRFTRREITVLADGAGFDVTMVRRYAMLPRNVWGEGWRRRVADSPVMARLYDAMDAMLSVLLSPVCQNYFFVAKKRGA